jgi:hypothetical protein
MASDIRNEDRLGPSVVIAACASSAGIHAALVRDHFREGAGAGLGFLVAALLLAILSVLVIREPANRVATAAAGVVLAGLLASYALAITTGLPFLHPEAEPVDGLALATKAVEAIGLLAALHLIRPQRAVALGVMETKGVST